MGESPIRRKLVQAMRTGPLDANRGAEVSGTTSKVAREYLCRLVKSGVAGVEHVRNTAGGPAFVAQYFLLPEKQPSRDVGKPRQATVSSWKPNIVRHPQDVAFFGPARKSA